MQVLQQLAVHTVLNGIHHLRFCLDGSPLLLYACGKELRLKGNFFQHVQDLQYTTKCHWLHCIASKSTAGLTRHTFVVSRAGIKIKQKIWKPL